MKTTQYETIRHQIHERVLKRVKYEQEIADGEILTLLDEEIVGYGQNRGLTLEQMKQIRQELFHAIRRLDVLQELLEDPEITEIMINHAGCIFTERAGVLRRSDRKFLSDEKLEAVIQQIVSGCNRVVNASSPIVDARLQDGSRVNVVLPPIALDGPAVTIRRFPKDPITMKKLMELGAVSEEVADFLKYMVQAGYNLFISGGTGAGKTTFLNALSEFIPAAERVVTIEDNAELQLRGLPNLVRLETRNANVEGCREITVRDLIKTSLRMRPSRVIIGEVRGEEAVDMIQAMNTGHDGSMSTGHANSTGDMLSRLETMILMGTDIPVPAIRAQIASAVDILIHLGRLRDKSRKLLEVTEITGISQGEVQMNPLFRFEEAEEKEGKIIGEWKKTGEIQNIQKLQRAGFRLSGKKSACRSTQGSG